MALNHELEQAFENVDMCFLATCEGATPNVVPVGFKGIWDGKPLLVDLFFDKTRTNLQENSRVALSIGWLGPKGGYQFKGNATVHRDGDAYEEARRILQRSGVDVPPFAAVVVDVDEVHRLDPGAGERIV